MRLYVHFQRMDEDKLFKMVFGSVKRAWNCVKGIKYGNPFSYFIPFIYCTRHGGTVSYDLCLR